MTRKPKPLDDLRNITTHDAGHTVIASVMALVSLAGCVASPPPPPKLPSADEAFAVQSRVVDCEWKAANRYDDSRYSVADLAQRVIGLCAVELAQARLAFRAYGLSPHDPQFDLDEFKQAVDIVEKVRKSKR